VQVKRLLAIGTEKVSLLDSKTKLLLQSCPASELRIWKAGPVGGSTGGLTRRTNRHGLTLEFRGSKLPFSWTFIAPSADVLKSATAALWDMIGVVSNPLDVGAGLMPLHRDILDLSACIIAAFDFVAVAKQTRKSQFLSYVVPRGLR
jgi:hypothetical protein